jgi:hypothetical protein
MMNWDAISAVSDLIGAAAVVITLIYIAKEIRQNTESNEAAGFQTWQSDSAAHWLTIADNLELGRDVAACLNDSRNLSEDSWISVASWFLNNMRQYQTTYMLHEKGMIDDDLFAMEMRMAARNLSIPGIRQWWDAAGKNQLLPRFCRALESMDPGSSAHWAWTKERGYVSRDDIEDFPANGT